MATFERVRLTQLNIKKYLYEKFGYDADIKLMGEKRLKDVPILLQDDYGEDKVKQHSADHHQRALPCRLGAELPLLGGLLHLFGVERLVYHAGYLDISAERKPAKAILRVAMFGFELEEREPRVEEKAEFFHSDFEKFGSKKVPALMQEY